MPTRLYIANATPTFTAVTTHGTWTVGSSNVSQLDVAPSGAAATFTGANGAAGTWTALLGAFITEKLSAPVLFTTTQTIKYVMGAAISSVTNTTPVFDLYAYVTKGDSNAVRGVLLTNTTDADTWTATATGRGTSTLTQTGGFLAAAGDRIVVEVGFQKTGTASASRTGTLNYGNTGADLTQGSTSVTTLAGWIEFSANFTLGTMFNNYKFPRASDGNTGIISVSEKIY